MSDYFNFNYETSITLGMLSILFRRQGPVPNFPHTFSIEKQNTRARNHEEWSLGISYL